MGCNNNSSSENTNFGQVEEEGEEDRLYDFCLKKKRFVKDVEAFYNAGRNKKNWNIGLE